MTVTPHLRRYGAPQIRFCGISVVNVGDSLRFLPLAKAHAFGDVRISGMVGA